MEKRTHSHLYRFYEDSKSWEFVEAIDYLDWTKQWADSLVFLTSDTEQLLENEPIHAYHAFIDAGENITLYRVDYQPDDSNNYDDNCTVCYFRFPIPDAR